MDRSNITPPTDNGHWKRSFWTIAAGQTVSMIGSSAVQFALIWWLALQTDSPLVMSLAGLTAFLPQFLLGPFAGVWIDRRKKRTVAIWADLGIGLVSGAMALYWGMSEPPYWIVMVILALRGLGGVFHTPAIQALMPLLVPTDQLMRANGLSQFLQSGAYMLGPVLGGLMYGTLAMPLILLTDLAGALAAASALAAARVTEQPHASSAGRRHFAGELREGIAVFREDRTLRHIAITTFICMVCYMPMSSLYPLMTSSYFALGSLYGSIVEFVYALGMMTVSLMMGWLGERFNKVRLIYGGLALLGLSSLACGLLPSGGMLYYWLFAAFCLVMGAASSFYAIPLGTYMQQSIPPEKLGRAFSLWGSAMSAAMPVGLLLSGPLCERYGVPPWFFWSGVLMMAAAAIDYLCIRRAVSKTAGR